MAPLQTTLLEAKRHVARPQAVLDEEGSCAIPVQLARAVPGRGSSLSRLY
ncbi:hypothetical protein [Halomonas stenophila]|uniref:Uncharacterized protein n=1 Tax=Halomonas stenophila TaxID=795312 RepID=A0A7W5N390_9GAMM|nr:hypothetical protein [Halomonas stenophila]MBB3233077.1 hypothetical protein [Halomonas stenophila]